MEINKDNLEKNKYNLEKALDNPKDTTQMNKETEIGFHEGALNTLISERSELFKMIQNVEKIMNLHISRLGELGVKIKFDEKK